jgi:hypothetical protein
MAKKTKKGSSTSVKAYNPHESLVIQAGVLVVVVSGIVLFAIAYAQYAIK